MINRIMIEFSDFDSWYKYVDEMHKILTAAPLVKVLFIVGFDCSICCNYFIMMRTRPCYHVTCHNCMPQSMYCSEYCGKTLTKSLRYKVFKKILGKGQCLRRYNIIFSIKIRLEGSFLSKMYQRL